MAASDMNSSMHSRRLHVQGTPESEFSNFECFQNYTAPEVFVQGLAGIVNQGDVELMIRAQKQMLQRFEKTNEMLLNCNALSVGRLKTTGEDFKKHIKLLTEMKKDLDYIFRKIRTIKTKLNGQYPNAFAEVQPPQRNSLAEEAAEDDVDINKNNKLTQNQQQKVPIPTTSTIPSYVGASNIVTGGPSESSTSKSHAQKSLEKKLSNSEITIDYVQMKHSPENGRSDIDIENGQNENNKINNNNSNNNNNNDITTTTQQKRSSIESNKSAAANDNSNDSSDCTSDTG